MEREKDQLVALGIGETLVDIFEDRSYTVGGAPLNVTFHLNQLLKAFCLGSAGMISSIGNDAMGDAILRHLEVSGMDTSFVSRDHVKPTGTALVFVQDGKSGFEISQEAAWDKLQPSPALLQTVRRAKAIVFGSLGQRDNAAGQTIRSIVAQVAGERLYDVNLRRSSRSGIMGYSEEIVRRSMELATIVKLNDEELEEVADMLGIRSDRETEAERQRDLLSKLAQSYDLPLIALTRGPQGAIILAKGSIYQLPNSKLAQHEVHPVGAGDSFAAGLLFGRILNWKIEYCLALADLMASWVVRNVSATPSLSPDVLQTIRNLYQRAVLEEAIG